MLKIRPGRKERRDRKDDRKDDYRKLLVKKRIRGTQEVGALFFYPGVSLFVY